MKKELPPEGGSQTNTFVASGFSRKRTMMPQKKSSKPQTGPKLTVTLRKSTIGFNKDQAKVVQGMGLRRIGHSVALPDTPATRGMILKVRHLVEVGE
jgi:large subunit ribosomal protein L30